MTKQVKYSEAVKKLEEIIAKIESEEIDVDQLSKKVKDAVELINICKEKIQKAELEVKKVVEDFKSGKKEAMNFFVGEILKKTSFKAEPKQVRELVQKRLK